MATNETSPVPTAFCVWADHVRRVYQHVDAATAKQAYESAKQQPECWEPCDVHESNGYRLSNEVQDLESEEFVRIDGSTHCKTCGSEIVPTVNDSHFDEGECGPCEYRRYATQAELVALASEFRQECSDRIRQYRDDLKEDFGNPVDLRERVRYWQKHRNRCDAAIAKAHG